MTSELLPRPLADDISDALLEAEVADFMTRGCVTASEAITEQVRAIAALEPLRTALYALSLAGTTRAAVKATS